MSKKIWPSNAISVILLPSGESGLELLKAAEFWTSQKLISRAIWVQPESIQKFDNKPPIVAGAVFGLDDQQEIQQINVDLFEELARQSIAIIRFVAVRYLRDGHLFDELQDTNVDLLAKYLENSIPLDSSKLGSTSDKRKFNKINLVVAPTELQHGFKKEIYEEGWHINVIASPEDRANPWSGDAFVRDDAKFVNFALIHVATVAGLWHGLPIGTFETFLRESSAQVSIWVSRIFVSGILTDGLVRRISAKILNEVADVGLSVTESHDFTTEGTYPIPENEIKTYVDQMIKETLSFDDNLLTYARPKEFDELAKSRWYEFDQIKSFFKFSKDKIFAMPRWTWLWLRRKVGKALTRKFQGEEGQAVVGIEDESLYDFRDRMLTAQINRITEISDEAKKALISPISSTARRTPTQIWQKIRKLVFGMLDGGNLTEYGIEPKDDVGVPVFSKVTDVIQDPNFVKKITNSKSDHKIEMNWQNLEEANLTRNEVVSNLNNLEQKLDNLLTKIVQIDEQINEIRNPVKIEPVLPELIEQGKNYKYKSFFAMLGKSKQGVKNEISEESRNLSNEDPSGFDEMQDQKLETDLTDITDTPDSLGTSDFEPEAEAAKADEVEDNNNEQIVIDLEKDKNNITEISNNLQLEIEAAAETLKELDLWIKEHERSYLWKLIQSMNINLAQAKNDLSKFEADVNSLTLPVPGQLISLRKAFNKSLLLNYSILTAALASLLIAYRYWEFLQFLPYLPTYQQMAIVFPSLYLSLLITRLLSYYREWSKFQREVLVSLHNMNNAAANSLHCRQEVHRLENLYVQTKDWLEIIARAIYTPWVVNDKWLTAGLKSLQDQTLPFALRIGQAYEGPSGKIETLKNETKQKMLVKGWRSDAFENLIQGIRNKMGFSGNQFDLEKLDKDDPSATNNSRNILKKHMNDSQVLNYVAKVKMRKLSEILQSDTLGKFKPPVNHEVDSPIDIFLTDSMDLELDSTEVNWDNFLKQAIISDNPPQTPVSLYSLTNKARQAQHHEKVKTYVILPKRLEKEYEERLNDFATIKSADEETDRSLELVVRIDMIGPLEVDDISVWSTGTSDQRVSDLSAASSSNIDPRAGI